MSKNVFVLLVTVLVLFCVSSGYAAPLLYDDFTNGYPLINDGVGSNWQDVGQGGSFSESGGYFCPSASSGWSLSAIGTIDTYELGTSFEFVLSSLSCSGDTTSTFGSPPSPAAEGQASMVIIDSSYDPTTDGGNAYKASGAALEVRIHEDTQGGYFFGLTASTGSDGAIHFLNDTSLVWDGSSDLVVDVTIGADGDSYSVTAGNVSTSGTLSSISGALTFSNPVYGILGIQTYGTNVASGTYDSVTIGSGCSEVLIFEDNFDDGDPCTNDGIGGDWFDSSSIPDAQITEAGSLLMTFSGGGYDLVSMCTEGTFATGSTATFTLKRIVLSQTGDYADWTNGYMFTGQAIMVLGDNSYNPSGNGANAFISSAGVLEVNVRPLLSGQDHYFQVVLVASTGADGAITLWSDFVDTWDPRNDELQVSVKIGSNGRNYYVAVTDGITELETSGDMVAEGALCFDSPFWTSLGIQTINGITSQYVAYEKAQVSLIEPVVPEIVSAVADDPDNGDDVISSGDTVTIQFDVSTNQPPLSTKAEIDGLIDFGGKSLGTDYNGIWGSDSNLVITVVDAMGAELSIYDTISIIADGTDDLKSIMGDGEASTSSAQLTGNWGVDSNKPWIVNTRIERQPCHSWCDRTQHGVGWETIEQAEQWDPTKTLIIITDMWRRHPSYQCCYEITMMASHLVQMLSDARERGVHVIHAPSNSMIYYEGGVYQPVNSSESYQGTLYPQRQMMMDLPNHDPPPTGGESWRSPESWELDLYNALESTSWDVDSDPAQIYDCRELECIPIMPGDGISDSGTEIWNYIQEHDIEHVIMTGTCLNYCVMGRSFGIRAQYYWGVDVCLCRELVEGAPGLGYNLTVDSKVKNYSIDKTMDLLIRHNERYWAKSISIQDILISPPPAPLKIVDNLFEDGVLFWELDGYEDYRLGGGLYNMSSDRSRPGEESTQATEETDYVHLETTSDSSIAGVMTIRYVDYKQTDGFDGVRIIWEIKSLGTPVTGSDYLKQGLCIGIVDAMGNLKAIAPSYNAVADHLYVSLKDQDDNGKIDGCMYEKNTSGIFQPITGTEFEFADWDGSEALVVTMTVREARFDVDFSKDFIGGGNTISIDMPSSFGSVDQFHVFASLVGKAGATAQINRLFVERLQPLEADMNRNGNVDLNDLRIFFQEWLAQGGLENCEGYWKFDQVDEGYITDSSSARRLGILYGAPSWQSNGGRFGGALMFDGSDDCVEIPGYTGINGTKSRTVCVWVKTSSGGDIIGWGDDQSDVGKWLLTIDQNGKFAVDTGIGNVTEDIYIADDQWHHVAAVLNNDDCTTTEDIILYVDGNSVSSTVVSGVVATGGDSITAYNSNVKIGFFDVYFNGLIDDVAIFSDALTAGQLHDIYTDELHVQSPANIRGEDIVNFLDFAIFADSWLDTTSSCFE